MHARTAFRRFWPLTRGDRHRLVLVCLCVVLAALAETAAILLFGELTDNALRKGSLSAFWEPAGMWLGVAAAGALVGYLGNSLAAWTAERFVMRLRARVFAHVQTLPPHFFQRHRQGDLVERLTGDVEAIEEMAVTGVVQTASALFQTVLFAAAALWLRWDLALATFLLAPLFLLAAKRFSGRVGAVARRERAADGVITSVVEESLGNIVLTQAYNRQRAEERRLRRASRAWMRASVSAARWNEMYEQLVEVVETVCVLAVIGLGAWEISAGRMTLGELLSFAAFIGYLYPPVRQLGQVGLTLSAAAAGAERLRELLDARPAVSDPAEARPAAGEPATEEPRPLRRAEGVVSLHDVHFGYPGDEEDDAGNNAGNNAGNDADKENGGARRPALRRSSSQPALNGASLTLRPGEFVLLTGPSGAGKSTLARLLLRFYDPDAGSVRLDGVPLDALPLAYVRENVTLLPQQTLLLHGTVRENIACGRVGATEEEIRSAAADADADGFVSALPDGYETVLAPHTTRLSGGQLQRIAIARAMLRDSPVLVLDEPTTGLDARAARRVLEPLRRLARGRATLVISHDTSLAAHADRVLVLEEGRLTERTPAGVLTASPARPRGQTS